MCVLYVRPPRRPVWTGPRLGLTDMQGAIPRGWCRGCGRELFLRGREFCAACEKEEHYDWNKESL